MYNIRFLVVSVFFVIVLGLFALWPSFQLALTGDDFQAKWRFDSYTQGYEGPGWNWFNYFFTDYGPQDSYVAGVYKFFGNNSFYNYFVSFLFRSMAALSFIPSVFILSNSRKTAFFSAIFFSICTTGLETTDWSFNTPSYFAIFFMNIFIYLLVKLKNRVTTKYLIISVLFFVMTIVAQPIRMTFLPSIPIAVLFLWFIQGKNLSTLKKFIFLTCIYLLSFFILMNITHYGDSLGLRGSHPLGGYLSESFSFIKQKGLQVLLTPIAQLGSIIFPATNYVKSHTVRSMLFQWIFILILLILYVNKLVASSSRKIVYFLAVTNILWLVCVWAIFVQFSIYPIQSYEFISYLIGGFLLTSLIVICYCNLKNTNTQLLILISSLLLLVPFLPPWIRNPGFLYETTGRYLIISAVGLTYTLSVILKLTFGQRRSIVILTGVTLFFVLHFSSSYTYLSRLKNLRSRVTTDKLRDQVPLSPAFGNDNDVAIYYFKGDPEIVRHVFTFGFPVIMAVKYNFFYISNLAYTSDYKEVVSAYINGTGVERFIHKKQRVPLDRIYGYSIVGDTLIDISNEVRSDLKNHETL